MIEIGKAIVSIDLFREFFTCDLKLCKGACCLEGESGAPVTDEESALLEEGFPVFKQYLPEDHCLEIDQIVGTLITIRSYSISYKMPLK